MGRRWSSPAHRKPLYPPIIRRNIMLPWPPARGARPVLKLALLPRHDFRSASRPHLHRQLMRGRTP